MIAKVQYNDFTGTAAADVSDFYLNSMDEYIHSLSEKYDMSRYHCEGCEFWLAGKEEIGIVFYCYDVQEKKIVPISLNKTFKCSDLFLMFKRLSIVIGHNIQDMPQPETETLFLE